MAVPPASPIFAAGQDRTAFVALNVPPWAWGALLILIAAMLAFDLFRHPDVIWVAFGNVAFGEYLSGYLIEKSLSIDNVFVWSMLFSTMAIPLKFQHRVLFWGIFGALTLRAMFIFSGIALIARFWWLLVVFGIFLVVTGLKIIRHRADETATEAARGLSLLHRVIPVSPDLKGHNFFSRINGKRVATPLFAALVVVEVTDLIFAVDSVPAILAVSYEPFLIFSSNAFAILGLRAMYFLLANARARFHYLSHALGAILIFVGLKMTFTHWYHLDTALSLGVIVTILVFAIGLSRRRSKSTSATVDETALQR